MELFKHQKEGGRVKEKQKCIRCRKTFRRHNGNTKAKYCSRKCACRDRNNVDHQKNAGRAGGKINGDRYRGTGSRGYIKEGGRHQHRIIAERSIGRKLKVGEIVHHRDGNKHNNSPDNLEVMTQSEHVKTHAKIRREKTI